MSSTSADPSYAAESVVIIQAGERRFTTARSTLVEGSPFFASLLSGRWDSTLTERCHFIDVDPDIFEHVLRYLRHRVFPIFYDRSKGHGYGQYLLVLQQARYFQIGELQKWLEDRTYLKSINVVYSFSEVESLPDIAQSMAADIEIEHHPGWFTKRVYLCPRGIPVHRGKPGACGMACRKAQGDAEAEYVDELALQMVVVKKKITFNESIYERGVESSSEDEPIRRLV